MKKKIFIVIVLASMTLISQAGATDYYVRPSGSGTNGDGLTYDTAWRGLSNINWSSVDSGNGILYVDGTHTQSLTVSADGESGTPVHVKGYTTSASVRGITIFNRSYVTVEDLITESSSSNGISIDTTSAQSNVTIKNVISRNNTSWGVTHWGESNAPLSNLVLDGVTVYNNGLNNSGFPGGVFFGHNGGDLTIKNSKIYNNGNAGQDHQVYVDQGSQGYIYNNEIHAESAPNSGGGIQCKGSCDIYNNIMHHAGQCALQLTSSSGDTYNVHNNVFYSNGWAGLCIYEVSNATLNFYNNSMYRNGTEGNSGWAREFVAESNLSTLYMKNNIFYGDGDQANISISSQSNASYDYNVNYQGGAQSQYQGSNGTYANPQYVNPPSDMTLQSNSPGISMNAGAYADGGGPSTSPPPTNTNAVPNPPSALAIN